MGGVVKYLIDLIYPVGSIYISFNETNPGTFLGGTWQEFDGERFLLCCDTQHQSRQTGGEAEHKLLVEEMPQHTHAIPYPNDGGPVTAPIAQCAAASTNKTWQAAMCTTLADGRSQPHNNMPPYITCYAWERIS